MAAEGERWAWGDAPRIRRQTGSCVPYFRLAPLGPGFPWQRFSRSSWQSRSGVFRVSQHLNRVDLELRNKNLITAQPLTSRVLCLISMVREQVISKFVRLNFSHQSFQVASEMGGCFPDSSVGKESTCNAGDPSSIPGLGRFPWRREWLPTPVFWPGEFHGLYSPWGHKESDATEHLWLSEMGERRRQEAKGGYEGRAVISLKQLGQPGLQCSGRASARAESRQCLLINPLPRLRWFVCIKTGTW